MATQKGTMQDYTIYSNALEEEVTLLAYLPSTFSPLHKYSLLIAQDGKDYFMYGKIKSVIEQLMENGEIDRTIVIGIPYHNVKDRYEKYHPNGKKNSQYLRFLAHELIPFLDQTFPTYQIGKGRALIGDSLGGTVALMAGLLYPHTFGKIAMQSPYIDEDIIAKIRQFSEPSLLQIYHSVGTKETAVKTTDGHVRNFIAPNRKAREAFSEKGFLYKYNEFDGDHAWTYWQPDVPRAIAWILSM
ncbi:esterase [Parageobacillus genomosp. 1]|uniref:Esterase n=1 Tax=Parageobacillus genomosp. 1 TaxID=1295642 RepID=A0ABC9VJF6_9BACL|nr:alpha/beta hydrolase-fold protein [Parageobacillus genomosp. 1]EZP78853.1 esterase [Parageobacillus genomosp. 1]